MKNGDQDWAASFPIREEVEDFAGRKRMFVITANEGPHGFTLRAAEEGRNYEGYGFAGFSETSPFAALGPLRAKMYRALATRHVTGKPGGYQMLHDKLSGRITTDDDGEVALIVDGVPVSLENLASILKTHEGWGINLEIRDPMD